jgi:hypothetical protein
MLFMNWADSPRPLRELSWWSSSQRWFSAELFRCTFFQKSLAADPAKSRESQRLALIHRADVEPTMLF